MTEAEKRRQLQPCCEENLGDAILKGHAYVVNLSERELLRMIKQLEVTPMAVVVRRSSNGLRRHNSKRCYGDQSYRLGYPQRGARMGLSR